MALPYCRRTPQKARAKRLSSHINVLSTLPQSNERGLEPLAEVVHSQEQRMNYAAVLRSFHFDSENTFRSAEHHVT